MVEELEDSGRKKFEEELEDSGRKKSETALSWWWSIENSKVRDLQDRRLLSTCEFVDAARAFLSVQASSASTERLFGDAGHFEGDRRQHCDPALTEMLLTIRSFVSSRIERGSSCEGYCDHGSRRNFPDK